MKRFTIQYIRVICKINRDKHLNLGFHDEERENMQRHRLQARFSFLYNLNMTPQQHYLQKHRLKAALIYHLIYKYTPPTNMYNGIQIKHTHTSEVLALLKPILYNF